MAFTAVLTLIVVHPGWLVAGNSENWRVRATFVAIATTTSTAGHVGCDSVVGVVSKIEAVVGVRCIPRTIVTVPISPTLGAIIALLARIRTGGASQGKPSILASTEASALDKDSTSSGHLVVTRTFDAVSKRIKDRETIVRIVRETGSVGISLTIAILVLRTTHEGGKARICECPGRFIAIGIGNNFDGHINASWVDNLSLTGRTLEASTITVACEAIDAVDARTTVGTTRRRAIVDIGLTIGTFEADSTVAGVAIDTVGAAAAVQAGVGRALVDVGLAIGPSKAGLASAGVARS